MQLNDLSSPIVLPSMLGVFILLLIAISIYLFAAERRRRLDLRAELDGIKFREQSRQQAANDRDQTVRSLAVGSLARQIAHDIRSPMTALKMAAASNGGVSDDVRNLLVASNTRLGQIADSLLKMKLKSPTKSGNAFDIQVSAVVRDVITEKRQQYSPRQNVQLAFDVEETLFVRIDPIEFKRVLSNLLHNAFAAVTGTGRIDVRGFGIGGRVKIEIKDSGTGMDARLLRVIRERSPLLIDGRPQPGFGLGIPHAQLIIETAAGRLSYENDPQGGATVAIDLPTIPPPVWFVPILRIRSEQLVIVVDDDPSMHEVWQNKLKAIGVKTAFFSSTTEVKAWLQELKPDSYICLVDYDLGDGEPTGLEFICLNNLATASVLVTGQAEELHDRCKELRLRLLSKSSLPNLKIEALIS